MNILSLSLYAYYL